MGKEEWKVNSKVKIILSRNWINMSKLLVNTVKNTVCVKGELSFTGDKVDDHSEFVVSNQLKKVEREISALREVRHVQWKLVGWRKSKNKWQKEGFKPSEEKKE